MPGDDDPIVDHYTIDNQLDQLLETFVALGKDLDQLTVDDLAPFDAFHLRGRQATIELASLAQLQPDHQLLDLGCGIGGTCRYLAATFGCHATGIDLTPSYIKTAQRLVELSRLADRIALHCGSALDLPFDDAAFDVVWTEHAQMNIADKQQFYREADRVLKPGGLLVFHDILAGATSELKFPVPWASDSSMSHLIAVDELWIMLTELGYDLDVWEDMSEPSRAFVATALDGIEPQAELPPGALKLHGVSKAILSNVLENLANDRVRVVQAVCRKNL